MPTRNPPARSGFRTAGEDVGVKRDSSGWRTTPWRNWPRDKGSTYPSRLEPLFRRETSGGHRPPATRRDANQTLALIHHGATVLGPVGVLSGDHPEVVDE